MTNTSLVWRLQNKLTLEDIEKMLSLKIINEKEAKELTFNTADDNEKVKSLEEQVKFLKELVEKLTNSRPQQVWTYVQSYQPKYPTWTTATVLGGNVINAISTASYTTSAGIALGQGNTIK